MCTCVFVVCVVCVVCVVHVRACGCDCIYVRLFVHVFSY